MTEDEKDRTADLKKALEDAYAAMRALLVSYRRRGLLLQALLDQGRIEPGELRDQMEEELR